MRHGTGRAVGGSPVPSPRIPRIRVSLPAAGFPAFPGVSAAAAPGRDADGPGALPPGTPGNTNQEGRGR